MAINRESIKRNAVAKAKSRKKGSMKEYFKGVKKELSKVVWPTKKELGTFTAVVLGACAFFALAFWLIDSGVLLALRSVLGIQ